MAANREIGYGWGICARSEWLSVHLEAILNEVTLLLPDSDPVLILLWGLITVENVSRSLVDGLLREVKNCIDGVHNFGVGGIIPIIDSNSTCSSFGLVHFDTVNLYLWHTVEWESSASFDCGPIFLGDFLVCVINAPGLKHGTDEFSSSVEVEVSNSNA